MISLSRWAARLLIDALLGGLTTYGLALVGPDAIAEITARFVRGSGGDEPWFTDAEEFAASTSGLPKLRSSTRMLYFPGSRGAPARPITGVHVDIPVASPFRGATPRPRWATPLDPISGFEWVTSTATGWPMFALVREEWSRRRPEEPQSLFQMSLDLSQPAVTVVRVRLEPRGFAVDTALFSSLWLPIVLLPVYSPRWWREGRRLRRGLCPACGQDLRWNLKAGCAMCGWRPA